MAIMEKIEEAMQQNEEKKKGLRNLILKLMVEWRNYEKDIDMSTTCLKECFNELDVKEKNLNAVQESVVESTMELDSIRVSVEKRLEEVEATEEEFRVFCDKESRELECKWEEFSLARKGFDEVVKLREEKLNEQEKMVERLWGETGKQLEDLGKSVDSKFKEISVKEKEFKERSVEFKKTQNWIREETDALLLKERKFKERVEALQSREKEMETRERRLDSVRKELMAKENCLEELRVKKTELDYVNKELTEKEHSLDSLQKEFREKETTLVSVKKQLRIKEDRLSLVKKELEIKEKSVDTINKKLELREQELISFQERLQLWEGELKYTQNEYRHRLEELDSREKKLDSISVLMQKCDGELEKVNFQKEQGLLKERIEDIALKEKEVEVRIAELKQREKHIEGRFKVLEEKEKQLKTVCNVPVKTELIDNAEGDTIGLVISDSADVRSFVTRDGRSLQIYLNEREKALDSMSDEVFKALQLSPNPGQLVLEAMEGFYPPHLRKGDTEFEGNVTRESCILLLEQLIRVSPKIQPMYLGCIQVAAYEVAKEWKVNMRAMTENQLEILGFLYLLAAYSLAPAFDPDELVSLLTIVVEHNKSKDLCSLLGVTERISCFIQNLIAKQQQVEAVKYAYAFDLLDHFAPIPILKDYFKQVVQIAENVCNRETRSVEEKNEAIEQSVASIRAIIKCIVDHELQSQYPLTQLEDCIESLTRLKADTTASVISEAQKPQQTQLQQMASACPSVPTDTKALSSTLSSEEASTCKLRHSDAFAAILVRMGGKNLQALLNDHRAELELFRIEVSRALRISTNPGMLLLEALGGFYPPEPHKEELEFNHTIIRKSCILLLEQLMRFSPEITPKAKLEASKLASDWKAKMIAEMENHLAILGYLLLIGAYSLAPDFNKNELESFCSTVAQHKNITQICHVLGIPVIKRPMHHSNGEPLSNIVERRSKQQNLISGCTSSVVHRTTTDPAKIVLDALRKCYSAERESSRYVGTKKRKRGKFTDTPSVKTSPSFNLSKTVFSDLLEQLREVSPEIRPQVKIEATEFAVEWRATLTDPWEVQGFLELLATFGLSSSFDSDDLVGLLEIAQHRKRAINLIKILGLADKIPSVVENLIKRGELLLAFTYIYVFELVGSFSPVLLLKNYVLRSRKQAKKTRNGCCPRKVQKKVKAAIECIEQHSLKSGYSPDELKARIVEIERLMEKPLESPHATVSSGGCTSVRPNSSHLTQHYVPDPRAHLSNFRAPTLHPGLFLHHNRLDAPPGRMFRNYSGPAPSGVPRPFLPMVNAFYHQHSPRPPNVIHPSYFS